MQIDDTLHRQLLAFARRRAPQVAEDLAQEALLQTWLAQAYNPAQYAHGVLKNLIANTTRIPKRSLWEDIPIPPERPDDVLERAEDYGRLSAALEQVLVWGDRGSTSVVYACTEDIPVLSIYAQLSAACCTFWELNVYEESQRRQLRRLFQDQLLGAYARCGCRIDPRRSRKEPASPTPEAGQPTEAPTEASLRVVAYQILDPSLERAFETAARFAGKRLKFTGCLDVAVRAVRRAAEGLHNGETALWLSG